MIVLYSRDLCGITAISEIFNRLGAPSSSPPTTPPMLHLLPPAWLPLSVIVSLLVVVMPTFGAHWQSTLPILPMPTVVTFHIVVQWRICCRVERYQARWEY